MTALDPTSAERLTEQGLRAEIDRLASGRAELLQQAHEMRADLSDQGPMDANDRAAVLTQAEELEAFAAELDHRRESLLRELDGAV